MATNPVFSAIVPEVLIEENYETWSVCIKNYLLSQDLWDIIEPESTPIGLDWRKKNATALHAIQISCGSKLLHQLKGYKSAKEAWDFLAKECIPLIQGDSELPSYSSVQGLSHKSAEEAWDFLAKCSPQLLRDSELASSSSVQDLHMAEKECPNSITGAEEKKARTNESQTLMRIRKVPLKMRTQYFKTRYEPSVVSIGPYHHCDHRLRQVEELKPSIAKKFANRLAMWEDIEFFRRFKEEFEKIKITGIKDFYDENVTNVIDEEKFMWMMFLDGCFILSFIFYFHFFEVERMGLKKHHIALVQQDLFLIENQLPFQVLKMLMSLTIFRGDEMYMLEKLTMNTCGRPIWMRYQEVNYEPLHLLDFLWIKLLGNNEGNNEGNNKETRILVGNKNHINRHLFHGVKELTAAGIHLRPISSGSLRDIKFKSYGIYGRLTLPHMIIERSTRQMFLNLIAYEAHKDNPKKSSVFTSYICFLDLLIDHAEDVKALRTAGILENYLDSDEEVAKLFNEMAFDLLPEVDTYGEVKFEIQRYLGAKQKVKMASWVAEVTRDHFKSPWTIIALLAGIIVISLTFVQTYFTIFPRSN